MNRAGLEFKNKNINAHSMLGVNDTNISATGNQKVILERSLFNDNFLFKIDEYKWNYNSNSSIVNSRLVLTNTTITSRRAIKCLANKGVLFSAYLKSTGNSKIGFESFYFELNDNILKINNQIIKTNSGSVYSQPLDFSEYHLFSIQYISNLGEFRFFIDNEEVYYIKDLGIINYNSYIKFETDSVLTISSVDVSSENSMENRRLEYKSIINPAERVCSNTPILSIKVKETLNGDVNTADLIMLRSLLSADKKCDFYLYTTRDITALTNHNFVSDLLYEYDYSSTALNLSKCKLVSFRNLNVAGTQIIDNLPQTEFALVKGDILIVLAVGANASCRAQFEFGECY